MEGKEVTKGDKMFEPRVVRTVSGTLCAPEICGQ